ncbi:osmotically inducible protein C [Brachybacterium halotolerans subsp. kimchii]|uniref:OsmC family protein n=1 Tax=Brachybacterium halotolerans TaxID=2795215 RepID=UPI001E530216|nr:osmotically inducible protein C [Brachybacterium halotolerans]UEJ83101.1 osmotically inducible protein C [Brachybacterium halotolerans subsp. kimchii]
MTSVPEATFPLPDEFGEGSVWVDRVGERSLVGRNRRGVEIPIGKGEGQVDPGELLKIALIGCAGMSMDIPTSRRLGEDFALRLWAHGTSDEGSNRYEAIHEQIQLDLDGLSADELRRLRAVIDRSIEASCTVQRTVVPGVGVDHEILGLDSALEDDEREEQQR